MKSTFSSLLSKEQLQHVIDTITDQDLNSFDDLHYLAFNQDYYIIGYYNADQWLQKHGISAWGAIEKVVEWERDSFGEVNLQSEDINSEKIVNLYVYILGEELLSEFDLNQNTESLLNDLKNAIAE